MNETIIFNKKSVSRKELDNLIKILQDMKVMVRDITDYAKLKEYKRKIAIYERKIDELRKMI